MRRSHAEPRRGLWPNRAALRSRRRFARYYERNVTFLERVRERSWVDLGPARQAEVCRKLSAAGYDDVELFFETVVVHQLFNEVRSLRREARRAALMFRDPQTYVDLRAGVAT